LAIVDCLGGILAKRRHRPSQNQIEFTLFGNPRHSLSEERIQGEWSVSMDDCRTELREIREAFDYAHERMTQMIGEFKDLGFFKQVTRLERRIL